MRKVYDCGVILIHLDQKSIKWHFSFSFFFFLSPSFFAFLIQHEVVEYNLKNFSNKPFQIGLETGV
jgi:hypothetical protein